MIADKRQTGLRRRRTLRFLAFGGATAVALGTAFGGSGLPAGAENVPLKMAFVYSRPLRGFGFEYTVDQGRRYIEAHVAHVETTKVESVASQDIGRVLLDLIRRGYKLIWSTCGFVVPILDVAATYPDVKFEWVAGTNRAGARNLGQLYGRIEEPMFLAGLAAGGMTKTNIIGFVAAFPVSSVIRNIDAFAIGVHEVNPRAVIRVVWTNSWYDPQLEKGAARSLLSTGADVLAQFQDSPVTVQEAARQHVWAIGYDIDMRPFAPTYELTAAVWNWGPTMARIARSVQDHTWRAAWLSPGMRDEAVALSPLSRSVPESVRQIIGKRTAEIREGRYQIFKGPLWDNTGRLQVPAGAILAPIDVWNIEWLVSGVIASPPAGLPACPTPGSRAARGYRCGDR